MRALLRKFKARFFHFMVSLIDLLKLQFWLLCKISHHLHCWKLNLQHAYVECVLKKIPQPYRPVLMISINYRFVGVRSNRASVTQQCGKFCGRIKLVQELKPNDLTRRRIIRECALESWPKIHFLIEKLCSATKLIFGSMGA